MGGGGEIVLRYLNNMEVPSEDDVAKLFYKSLLSMYSYCSSMYS